MDEDWTLTYTMVEMHWGRTCYLIYNLAGFSTKSLINKSKCNECKEFLNSEKIKSDFIDLKEFKDCHLFRPRKEVVFVIQHCEAILQNYLNNKNILKPNFYNTIVTKAINTNKIDKYFHQLKFHCQDHRYTIVHFLSNKYITSRIKHFLKNLNIEIAKVLLRKRMTTLVHFNTQ